MRVELLGTYVHARVAIDALLAQAARFVDLRFQRDVHVRDKRHQRGNGADFAAPFFQEHHFENEDGGKHDKRPAGLVEAKQVPHADKRGKRKPHGAH